MRVLVFGSTGMAGHVITRYLQDHYEVRDASRNARWHDGTVSLDVETELDRAQRLIDTFKPQVIVNCIGCLIGSATVNTARAIYLNSFFPHWLARQTARIIHLSTDCVFSGAKGNYAVNDIRDATSVYAVTKSLGELNNDKDLTVRTSIVGPELKDGEGLFHWFMKQKGDVKGFTNHYWNGITTLQMAKFIVQAIDGSYTRIAQLGCEKLSKYEMLKHFQKVWGKTDVRVNEHAVTTTVDKTLQTMFPVPSFEMQLQELKEWHACHFPRFTPGSTQAAA